MFRKYKIGCKMRHILCYLVALALIFCLSAASFTIPQSPIRYNVPEAYKGLFEMRDSAGWSDFDNSDYLHKTADSVFSLADMLHYMRRNVPESLMATGGNLDKDVFGYSCNYTGGTLWTNPCRVLFDGNFAYCAMNPTLVILDVSDPLNPRFVSDCYVHSLITDIDLYRCKDGRLYAFASSYYCSPDFCGLTVIDVEDPYHPSIVGSYNNVWAYGVSVDYDMACLSAVYDGFQAIKILDPHNPEFRCKYNCSEAVAMERYITIGYGGGARGNLWIFNLSNINYSISMYSQLQGIYPYCIVPQNYYLYIADPDLHSFEIVDVHDRYNPVLMSSWPIPGADVWDVYLDSGYAYVACGSVGALHIMDVSDPTLPDTAAIIPFNGDAWEVELKDDSLAYVAAGEGGLRFLDVSDPTNPGNIGFYNMTSNEIDRPYRVCLNLEVAGNIAYVATGAQGLSIVGVTDAAHPRVLSTLEVEIIRELDYERGYVFIAYHHAGVAVADVSNPYEPEFLTRYILPGTCLDVVADSPYVYAVTDTAGFFILDAEDPLNMSVVGRYNEIYNASNPTRVVTVSGDYAYVGDNTGVQVLDISNPASPEPTGRFTTYGSVGGIVVRDNRMYIADQGVAWSEYIYDYFAIRVVDVSDPKDPVGLGDFDYVVGPPVDIDVCGKFAVVGSNWVEWGVQFVDISDPENMTVDKSGIYWTNADVIYDVDIDGNRIYISGEWGLTIASIDLPYICGDVNGDNSVQLLDVLSMIRILYMGEELPANQEAFDVDGNDAMNILDIVYLLYYLYRDGPAPLC